MEGRGRMDRGKREDRREREGRGKWEDGGKGWGGEVVRG